MLKIFCKHQWKVISNYVSESIAERAERLNYSTKSMSADYFSKLHEVIVVCDKCGAIKHFTERI